VDNKLMVPIYFVQKQQRFFIKRQSFLRNFPVQQRDLTLKSTFFEAKLRRTISRPNIAKLFFFDGYKLFYDWLKAKVWFVNNC